MGTFVLTFVLIILVPAVATYLLAASGNPAISAMAAVLPLGVAVLFLVEWLGHRAAQAQGDGDPSPDFVAFNGAIITAALIGAACAGWLMRSRKRRQERS